MPVKTSLVFVGGSWHTPQYWEKVIALLEPRGYTCSTVVLPSTIGDPSKGLGDDVSAAREVILSQTKEGRDVVVFVHSFGGVVGESAIKGLTHNYKRDGAKTSSSPSEGHVIGITLMATGFAIEGKSFIDRTGGAPPPFWRADTEGGFAELNADCRQLLYHDLPPVEGQEWVSRLTKQTLKSLFEGGEFVYEGWRDVPCWYLRCTQDQAFPPEAQAMMPQFAKGEGADVTVREVEASHSPMLSKALETADFIAEAAADCLGK